MKRQLVLALTVACTALALSAADGGLSAQKKAPAQPEKPKDPAASINTPRADARKIAFDTTEATWASVDVSPDGRAIVFDILGDIYTLPADGGQATAISRGPAYDHHPRFSPDGRTIAFSSDENGMENLWLMDADGKNRRAITDGKDAYVRSAAWTPDGNYLIAKKEDAKPAGIPPVELWMYHRLGGSGIKLTSSDEWHHASGPVVSRDGRYIYFSARRARFNYVPDMTRGLWHIVRFDRQTGQTHPLTTGFGGAVRPAISPDGRTMAFLSRRDADTVLVARDLPSGAERIVARGMDKDQQEGFAPMDVWPNYAFTPDGQHLVLPHRGALTRVSLATGTLQPIAFTASVEQQAAPLVAWQERVESGPVQARILRWTTESPDGRFVAFDAFGRIWLQEIAGGKAVGSPKRLTADDDSRPSREYAPSFSPDGRFVAYVTWTDVEGGHVWKAPVAGGTPQQLTRSPGHYANPSWSPGGDRLAVIRGSGLEFRGQQPEEENFFEIRWLPASGGDPELVTTVETANAMRFHPQAFWSADGTRLVYRDPVEQAKPTDPVQNDLVSVRLDGTDRKAHLRLPAVDDIAPSPDGAWVAFTSRDNVYVTALPGIQTKEPPEVSAKEGSVPVWRLSDAAGAYVAWAERGRTITWSLGNTFHRLPLEAAMRFVEEQKNADKRDAETAGKEDAAKKEAEKPRVPASQQIQISLSMPRHAPSGSFVLRGARVITMKRDAAGRDEILPNADIVVTGNRIAGIGPAGSVKVPEGAREFDARGKTVIPGLVDAHAHLHYSGFEVFPETKWEYIANLAYGVTTVYDPSAPSLDVFAQGEMVEAGVMLGPRVYSSGDVLYGGQQAPIFAEVNSLDDAKRQVKRMKAYGARMIKVYQQPRREQRIWFAEAAREEKMLLTAEGAGELHTDLTMALDGFTAFEHSLPVALRRDAVQFLAKSGTWYTPTLIVSYGGPTAEHFYWQTRNPHDDPKLNRFTPHRTFDHLGRRRMFIPLDEYHFPVVAESAARVADAGGRVALGAHGQLQGLGMHWEMWAQAGDNLPEGRTAMAPIDVLRASTIGPAEKLGFAPDLGSVEPGKLADLVVLDADPLADIHNTTSIRWVIRNGELFDAGTMRQEWPSSRPLPPFFWKERPSPTPTAAR
jgi:Tol biopolymer transport system component/imidazolonepropionase-like amidohydrolase